MNSDFERGGGHFRRGSIGARLLATGLICLYVAQCGWFIRTQSMTVDESDHIIAGVEAWKFGELERWHEHPPLARLWMTLPVLGKNLKYVNRPESEAGGAPVHAGSQLDVAFESGAKGSAGEGWHLNEEAVPVSPGPSAWVYGPRAMNVVLGVLLLLLLWVAAREFFSEWAALFVLGLAAVSPELVAHYSLATTDGAGTLFTFLAVMMLVRWWRCPDWRRTWVLGGALGLALIAKLNTLPMVGMVLGLTLVLRNHGSVKGEEPSNAGGSSGSRGPSTPPNRSRSGSGSAQDDILKRSAGAQANLQDDTTGAWGAMVWDPRAWRWGKAAAMALGAALIVWAGYFFHVSRVAFGDGLVTLHFAGYTKLLTYPLPVARHFQLFIPACEYLTGLGMVFVHNMEGHHSFFLGQISSSGGWKLYFPVAVLLKWPVIVLAMGLWGALLVLLRRPWRRELLLIGIFPAVFFLMAVTGRINIGVRHVLPVYPFLLLFAGAAAEWVLGRRRWAWVLAVLVALQAGDTLRFAPGYLSYFNVWVDPAKSWSLLSDSNLDWGQGLVALKAYQEAHPEETIHLAYFGLVDPGWYGIRYVPLKEDERVTGTVVVSATHLSGQLLKNPEAYRWVLGARRKTILDHCLFVFEVK
ncbi:MAG TPA: glycosyltransferase family 39 protein [Terriglobales bacterium]|nr:glycosyltransferase family 39 protein [Terriglobales bacterium]